MMVSSRCVRMLCIIAITLTFQSAAHGWGQHVMGVSTSTSSSDYSSSIGSLVDRISSSSSRLLHQIRHSRQLFGGGHHPVLGHHSSTGHHGLLVWRHHNKQAAATAAVVDSPGTAGAATDAAASTGARATSAYATSADAIVTQSDIISGTTALDVAIGGDNGGGGGGGGNTVAVTAGEREGGVALNSKQLQRSQGSVRSYSTANVSDAQTAKYGNPLRFRNRAFDRAGQGPCKGPLKRVFVNTASDINNRLKFAPTQIVELVLTQSMVLKSGLVFGRGFSCTVFRPLKGKTGLKVSVSSDLSPALSIMNISNVLVANISFSIAVKDSSGDCDQALVPETYKLVCPAVFVYRSFGVQIVRGSVFGRIQISRTMAAVVDSMKVTSIFSFERSMGPIYVLFSGYGPSLVGSGISISNNEIYGTDNAIVMDRGAVGVFVHNNYIHDYGFAGIRCGNLISAQGDCMLTRIYHNYVYKYWPEVGKTDDSGGIYYNTHWINPGNIASCNYVEGGDHCYYIDNMSSGVKIIGSVCLGTSSGIKNNGGIRNEARFIILKDVYRLPAWTQCLFVTEFNCNSKYGRLWWHMYTTYYNTPAINKAFPWLASICSATSASTGAACNPPGTPSPSVTAKCSGLSFDNVMDIVNVGKDGAPSYYFCDTYPQVPSLNYDYSINISNPAAAKFLNLKNNNLGLLPASPLFQRRPKFRQCDRSLVGIKQVDPTVYRNRFNIPMPWGFKKARSYSSIIIQDQKWKG